MATPLCWFEDVLGRDAADDLVGRASAVGEDGSPARVFDAESLVGVIRDLGEVVATVLGTGDLAGKITHVMVTHADGQFTELRNDRLLLDPAPLVTFSYFFHRRPKLFAGGLLRVFDTCVRGGEPTCAPAFREVYPDHDTLVFFPADAWYEVSMVVLPHPDPAGGRMAVHGWMT